MKWYRVLMLPIPFFVTFLLLFASGEIIRARNSNGSQTVVLTNLHKSEGGISSRYVITNLAMANATTAHTFLGIDGNTYSMVDSDLQPGEGKIYDLGDISVIPDGFDGSVTVTSDQPITGTVFPDPVPPGEVIITGVSTTTTGVSNQYVMSLTPITVTLPITVVWSATEQVPVVKNTESLTDSATFAWNTPGTKMITVTVANLAGQAIRSQIVWVYEKVDADFSASPTSGIPPLMVTFQNQSIGDFNKVIWSFGDGFTSTVINPTHVYTETGSYTVTIMVSGNGGSDQRVKPSFININGFWNYLPLIRR